jgi:hypothetical protein
VKGVKIPDKYVSLILDLYAQGLKSSEISRKIEADHGILIKPSAIRMIVSRHGKRGFNFDDLGFFFKKFYFGEKEKIKIYPIADLHIGANEKTNKAAFTLIDVLSRDEEAYFIFLGDLVQFDIVKPGVPFNKNPGREVELLFELLSKVNDKTLGILAGNHEDRLYKRTGISLFKDFISTSLQIPYFEDACSFSIGIGKKFYTFYAIHGYSGARKIGGKVNALDDLRSKIKADVYITAHSHEPFVIPKNRINITAHGPVLERIFLVNCSTTQTYAGYAVKRGLDPSVTWAIPEITVSEYELFASLRFLNEKEFYSLLQEPAVPEKET